MTGDNANNKLTLSGKSTLTLKGLGDAAKSRNNDGKKVVQVEVRKKRVINTSAPVETKVEIDEATAAKLRLIAEAKEHEAKRRLEEEEKERLRQIQREEEEKARQQAKVEEAAAKEKAEKEAAAKSAQEAAKAQEAEEKHFVKLKVK